MRESRTYGSVRGACDETHVPTATAWMEGEESMRGVIATFDGEEGVGTIRGKDEQLYAFTRSNLVRRSKEPHVSVRAGSVPANAGRNIQGSCGPRKGPGRMDDCRFSLSDSVIFADTIKSVVPMTTHGFWGKSSRKFGAERRWRDTDDYRHALLIVGHAFGDVYILAFVSASRRSSTFSSGRAPIAAFMTRYSAAAGASNDETLVAAWGEVPRFGKTDRAFYGRSLQRIIGHIR